MNTTTTCPSCSKSVDLTTSPVCPGCGYQISVSGGSLITQPVRRVRRLPVLVLLTILIDITGSTGRFAKGVLEAIRMIFDQIAVKVPDPKVYLYGGGDLDYGQDCTLLASGVSPEDALSAVERLPFQGGGDEEETHADSVETVLNSTPWEVDRRWRNVLILFLTADSKPSRSGVNARELGERLQGLGIMLFVVAEDYSFAKELVDAGGGLFFPITNDPDPVQMQQIASSIGQTLLLTVGTPATKVMTTPLAST